MRLKWKRADIPIDLPGSLREHVKIQKTLVNP